MRISWVLWWIVYVFWLLCLVGFVSMALFSGIKTLDEVYGLICIVLGLFFTPILCQVVWLIINLIVGHNLKNTYFSKEK